jgi:hypothetical protein
MEIDRAFMGVVRRAITALLPERIFRRTDDARAAAIVEAEPHGLDIVALGQPSQQLWRGTGESIDGLIDIADREKSHTRAETQAHDQSVQSEPEVLIFVDCQDGIFCDQRLAKPFVGGERLDRQQRHIVEVN